MHKTVDERQTSSDRSDDDRGKVAFAAIALLALPRLPVHEPLLLASPAERALVPGVAVFRRLVGAVGRVAAALARMLQRARVHVVRVDVCPPVVFLDAHALDVCARWKRVVVPFDETVRANCDAHTALVACT